uniref:Glutamine amidotransferase type-2 domain-containing protein n=1 Tax=Corethron hystrix TaxID=216773 RepID=A0A7S1BSN8_9STRA|mmetsp:Transcript_37306/g.87025  ORF Transcript_37306/g.87025 Transcript_37306/m.87025 type:complete len:912 (+) Transcript_37306:278-3013(+)
MCGIAATIDLSTYFGIKPSAKDLTKTIIERLKDRGPDASSIKCIPEEDEIQARRPRVVLGHTRLAIVGGEFTQHPLSWSNGKTRTTLIHNGEIYNYRELKELLILEGYCQAERFSTDCDSEVLLACIALRDIEWTLENIKGMFSFMLVEYTENQGTVPYVTLERIIAARDFFGIKPLCYTIDNVRNRIVFASQVSAIPFDLGLDQQTIEIKDVLPSTYIELTFQQNVDGKNKWNFTLMSHKYNSNDLGPYPWCPIGENYDPSKLFSQNYEKIRTKLIDAVRLRLPPHGSCKTAVLLSGGLDSSLISSIAAHLLDQGSLDTFNIRYQGEPNDDSLILDCHHANLVNKHISKIRHHEVVFTFDEGMAVLPHVIQCLETCDAVCIRAAVPLFLLSKHISSLGFKVVLCGEGADESTAGYRLFEEFLPTCPTGSSLFLQELNRRLINIDTSELQRVDRCTSAHGLEARVPFLDLDFVQEMMNVSPFEKMTHSSLGRIQKWILRRAFDTEYADTSTRNKKAWLPDSVLYREKEQFADGIGRGWIKTIQEYAIASEGITDGYCAEKALYKKLLMENKEQKFLDSEVRMSLVKARQARRQSNQSFGKEPFCSKFQPIRWLSVCNDSDLLDLDISMEDAQTFVQSTLGWSSESFKTFTPTLASLNCLITSMLQKIPFHNLTLLLRERRPPTLVEIKNDMMTGLGGPCSVVNSFFAALLVTLGFGPCIYLLSCQILGQNNCHVAILVQIKGLRYFVDVANAKPYFEAVHLGDSSIKESLSGSFKWNLSYNAKSSLMEVKHFSNVAMSFDPSLTVHFRSFRKMIQQSRTDRLFGPFLTGLRFCLYPSISDVPYIMAVRDMYIYEGTSIKSKQEAASRSEIENFARNPSFSNINGFSDMVEKAVRILDKERPAWFDVATKKK